MVTSRATDENLTDDQDPRTSEIMASPRQPLGQSLDKPAPANSAPATTAVPDDGASAATAGGGVSSNGASARGNEDAPANGGPAAADATVVDGIPALPADTIGEPRSAPPTDLDAHQAAGSKAAAQPQAGDSPVLSFGSPATAPAKPAVEDPTIAYPAESAAKQAGDNPAGSRPAPADPPSVSPAAFAWGMPDPPPNSRSSPARTFLRSGATAKNPPAPQAGPTASPGQPPAGENPAPARGAAARKTTGARPKRTARQAHLTVARIEPWSVMKFSFVVSLVAFVILFVAVSVLYGALSALGVFDSLQRVVSDVTSSQGSAGVNAKAWFSASRVLGYTALLGSLNIVLITAMSTIGAVVYNLTSRLVGGVEVTLKETE
jgi:hypothetical protein